LVHRPSGSIEADPPLEHLPSDEAYSIHEGLVGDRRVPKTVTSWSRPTCCSRFRMRCSSSRGIWSVL